jgi:hypothetical protein
MRGFAGHGVGGDGVDGGLGDVGVEYEGDGPGDFVAAGQGDGLEGD